MTGRLERVRLNQAICKALGLDPNAVQRIVIILDAVEPTKVLVRQYVLDESAQAIEKVLRQYELKERSE